MPMSRELRRIGGKPAFPLANDVAESGGVALQHPEFIFNSYGLTAREWLIGMALSGGASARTAVKRADSVIAILASEASKPA